MTTSVTANLGRDAVAGLVSAERQKSGTLVIRAASIVLALLVVMQALNGAGILPFGFATWRPILVAYGLWGVALCIGNILRLGEAGWRALFVLPAVLFTLALVIFPTFFGLYIAFTDWNLSSATGRQFNGLANFYQLVNDPYFWNALGNMVFYVLSVLVQYAIAFGLALLLNADIRGRKFFRVAFLLPFMLSPVAVSWMIGKSMLEYRFGPGTRLLRAAGLGQSVASHLALAGQDHHRRHGCLGVDPLHDDPAAGRPPGHAQGSAGGSQG